MERMRCVVTSLIRLARIGVGRGPTEAIQTSSRQLEAALDPRLPTERAQSAASRRQMLTDSAHEESASAVMVRVCRFPFETKRP
jgi:hypothetical protein